MLANIYNEDVATSDHTVFIPTTYIFHTLLLSQSLRSLEFGKSSRYWKWAVSIKLIVYAALPHTPLCSQVYKAI